MPSAGERLVGTVEMLEMILPNLDFRTLLLSQRTCKTFNDTIAGSTALQQKLFFKKTFPPPKWYADAIKEYGNLMDEDLYWDEPDMPCTFLRYSFEDGESCEDTVEGVIEVECVDGIECSRKMKQPIAGSYPSASWRRMYLDPYGGRDDEVCALFQEEPSRNPYLETLVFPANAKGEDLVRKFRVHLLLHRQRVEREEREEKERIREYKQYEEEMAKEKEERAAKEKAKVEKAKKQAAKARR